MTSFDLSLSPAQARELQPTISELLLRYITARERGDDRRAVAYRETAVRRILEKRRTEGVQA